MQASKLKQFYKHRSLEHFCVVTKMRSIKFEKFVKPDHILFIILIVVELFGVLDQATYPFLPVKCPYVAEPFLHHI
jgi:hypothetical protein